MPGTRALRCQQDPAQAVARRLPNAKGRPDPGTYTVLITLNGERFELERRLTVTELLSTLDIDPRRVAIEHNLAILKRHTFSDVVVDEGDTVEIVNFVGGG